MTADVQAALSEALRGQQHEDAGDIRLAMESYYKAACQLSYFADVQVEAGTAMAELCAGLVKQYEQRIAVLQGKQASGSQCQWVQLEQHEGSPEAHNLQLNFIPSNAAESTVPCTKIHQWSVDHTQQETMLSSAARGSIDPQQAFGTCGAAPGSSNSNQLALLQSCQRMVSGSMDDVVGLEDIKMELEEAVFLPLQYPHLFKGIRQPARTFLLHGPPGTGKTLLVEKVAAEAGFMLLALSPSMILSKWAGDSEKTLSAIFELARSFQPCIIFLDEVDSMGRSRSNTTDAGAHRLLTELLIQLTQVKGEGGVYVFGATNRMHDCDPALLRRFSRRMQVPLPSETARRAFFQSFLARPEIRSTLCDGDISIMVAATEGYSGSDLAELCRTAALAPVRDFLKQRRAQMGSKRRRIGEQLLPSCLQAECLQLTRRKQGSAAPAGRSADPASNSSADSAHTSEVACCSLATHNSGNSMQHTGPVILLGSSVLESALRSLCLADLQAALELVKPAAADTVVEVG